MTNISAIPPRFRAIRAELRRFYGAAQYRRAHGMRASDAAYGDFLWDAADEIVRWHRLADYDAERRIYDLLRRAIHRRDPEDDRDYRSVFRGVRAELRRFYGAAQERRAMGGSVGDDAWCAHAMDRAEEIAARHVPAATDAAYRVRRLIYRAAGRPGTC